MRSTVHRGSSMAGARQRRKHGGGGRWREKCRDGGVNIGTERRDRMKKQMQVTMENYVETNTGQVVNTAARCRRGGGAKNRRWRETKSGRGKTQTENAGEARTGQVVSEMEQETDNGAR